MEQWEEKALQQHQKNYVVAQPGSFSGLPCNFLNCVRFYDLNSWYRQKEM